MANTSRRRICLSRPPSEYDAPHDPENKEMTPEQLVQRQLDCYNAKDLDGLLATYAPDASQFDLHGNLLAKDRDEFRKRFAIRFAEPDLHAKLVQRIVMGNVVTDYEIITRNFPATDPDFPNAKGTIEMLCIYEVDNDLIVRATFAVGKKSLS